MNASTTPKGLEKGSVYISLDAGRAIIIADLLEDAALRSERNSAPSQARLAQTLADQIKTTIEAARKKPQQNPPPAASEGTIEIEITIQATDKTAEELEQYYKTLILADSEKSEERPHVKDLTVEATIW